MHCKLSFRLVAKEFSFHVTRTGQIGTSLETQGQLVGERESRNERKKKKTTGKEKSRTKTGSRSSPCMGTPFHLSATKPLLYCSQSESRKARSRFVCSLISSTDGYKKASCSPCLFGSFAEGLHEKKSSNQRTFGISATNLTGNTLDLRRYRKSRVDCEF